MLKALGLTLLCFVWSGCQQRRDERASTPQAGLQETQRTNIDESKTWTCEGRPFERTLDIAEASGATLLPSGRIMVVGDSGQKGEYIVVDIEGHLVERGVLPLDASASDDLEGLSLDGDELVALTSAGQLMHFKRHDGGYKRVKGAYPIGSLGLGFVCKKKKSINCGKNYEGLCIMDRQAQGRECQGYAVSKNDGTLYCLGRNDSGEFFVESDRSINLTTKGKLTGCHFEKNSARLWVVSNLLGGLATYRVDGNAGGDRPIVEFAGRLGVGFPEAVALTDEGDLVHFSDTRGKPSLASRTKCQ